MSGNIDWACAGKRIIGGAVGAIAGIGLGFLVVGAFYFKATIDNPDAPDNASVAFLLFLFVPTGVMTCAPAGWLLIIDRPVLFYWLVVPIALATCIYLTCTIATDTRRNENLTLHTNEDQRWAFLVGEL